MRNYLLIKFYRFLAIMSRIDAYMQERQGNLLVAADFDLEAIRMDNHADILEMKRRMK